MSVLALDIGGANLKWADDAGRVGSEPLAVWREPAALSERLMQLCEGARFDALLVTMTAEMCDCFDTRAAGVARVLEAVEVAASGRGVHVWSTAGRFVTPDTARRRALDVAAANWHALATAVARHVVPEAQLLVDVGSTTSDVIPLADGACAAKGLTDTQRLATGELVYLGIERTPLMAVASCVEWRGERVAVMAEHFATMGDVMVLAGLTRERPDDVDTADGRPVTRVCAAGRILRMVGADSGTHTVDDAVALAQQFLDTAGNRMSDAIGRVTRDGRQSVAVVSGSGETLGARALADAQPLATIRRLSDIIGADASAAACADALVRLWSAPCPAPPSNAKSSAMPDRTS